MSRDFAVGIDLGLYTSKILISRDGYICIPVPDPITKSPIIPSVVAMSSRGELLVGEVALNLIDIPGCGIREVKRKMGTAEKIRLQNQQFSQEFTPEEISSKILLKLKKNVERAFSIEIKDVVISVPANFSNAAREATGNSARLAGLNITRLINEPTAIVLAFGIANLDAREKIIVFDFGGGTLNISIFEMMNGVLDCQNSYGDPQLGGKDFDEKMINLILNKFKFNYPLATIHEKALLVIKSLAESVKKILSENDVHEINMLNFATQGNELIDLRIEVTRQEFEQEIAPLLERVRECMRMALNTKSVKPSEIDRVLLSGGTTCIPAVRQLVAEMCCRKPEIAINNNSVGIGACIAAMNYM
jgi:molecular chaperone DnaK